MKTQTFRIETYLRPGDASHVAHKELSKRWAELAHDHDYYEVFLIEHGQTDHWINGARQRLGRGHLAFVRPSDAHAFRADARQGCRIFNIMFRAETVAHFRARYGPEIAGRFFDHTGPLPDAHDLQDTGLGITLRLLERLMHSPLTLARVEEFLLALINQVLAPADLDSHRMPSWLSQACKALRQPAVFRQGTAGFIAVAGRSHEHLCRSCRTHLGVTPSAHVNQIRASYAAERLVRTQDPIAQIASEVGMDNIGHFYRVFRSHFGTTPRAYRLSHQKDPFERA
ncbi:MAG: AraC family transcriptional regulator [Pseudomonadota bacterium]